MDDLMLRPWMLASDWRADARPLVIVDLDTWPVNVALDPLPPVPVLAAGSPTHPQAGKADVRLDAVFTREQLVGRIVARPLAAAALVRLLRAIDGLPTEQALPLESFAYAMLQGGEEHADWLRRRPVVATVPPGILHVERTGPILDLRIDRSHARNMIDHHLRDALHEAFMLAALDPAITQVRLRGTGRCFSMGADLGDFGVTRDPAVADAIRARTLPAYPMSRRAAIYHVHVVGGCVGSGLELAAWAGTLTATSDAWFQLPETAMGILPGFGGCVSIPRRVGRQRTAGMMLSGKRIGVRTALDWGLVDRIVDDPTGDDGRADARVA